MTIISLSLLIVMPLNATASCEEDKAVLAQGLKLCDQALEYSKQTLDLKSDIIKAQETQVNTLLNEVADLKSDRNSILNNKLLWVVIGVGVGALIFK